jgi:hypothetical protein
MIISADDNAMWERQRYFYLIKKLHDIIFI